MDETIPCPICGQNIGTASWSITAHRQAHENADRTREYTTVEAKDHERDWLQPAYQCVCGADYSSDADLTDHLRYWAGTSHMPMVSPLDIGSQTSVTTWAESPPDPYTFEDYFSGVFNEALELLVERQRKYGPKNILQQGILGVFTRLRDDKMARLARALNGTVQNGVVNVGFDVRGVPDESIEDTLLDIMNYAAILLSLKRGEWCPPLKEELDAF